jgi:hypothetical protein
LRRRWRTGRRPSLPPRIGGLVAGGGGAAVQSGVARALAVGWLCGRRRGEMRVLRGDFSHVRL